MIRTIYTCKVIERKTNKLISVIQTSSIFRLRKFINKYGYNDNKKYYYKFNEEFKKDE